MPPQEIIGSGEMTAAQERDRGTPRRQRRRMIGPQIQARRVLAHPIPLRQAVLRMFSPQHEHDRIRPPPDGSDDRASKYFPTHTGM